MVQADFSRETAAILGAPLPMVPGFQGRIVVWHFKWVWLMENVLSG
jgi:hypothetical protein